MAVVYGYADATLTHLVSRAAFRAFTRRESEEQLQRWCTTIAGNAPDLLGCLFMRDGREIRPPFRVKPISKMAAMCD